MSKYLVIFKGSGQGCDYTIGCNLAYEEVEADTKEDALLKAYAKLECYDTIEEYLEDYDSPRDEDIDEAIIYNLSDYPIIGVKWNKWVDEKYPKQPKQNENPEYEEYLRLKKKFEVKIEDNHSSISGINNIPLFSSSTYLTLGGKP
jgi:hypothetical protein